MSYKCEVDDSFIRIPTKDGRVLAGRLWRPVTPGPVPAILEVSPYRVFDLMRPAGENLLAWWAAHGYAVLSLEDPGSGGSTGLLADEYLDSEIADAVAVVEWLAAQTWCDGAVGMSGFSWSAFVALRVAQRKPPGLKALVLGGVSEDGWVTDIHNLGGATYAARVDWAGTMLMFNALPPDPQQIGAAWRSEWLARLAANRPWIETWLAHPERDGYWQDKAVNLADTDAPTTPLLLYAGLADKYATSVLRIAAQWRGQVCTIIGPWDHEIPCIARRRPRIGYLQEGLAWWDHWLRGRPTDALAAAPLRLWLAEPDREGGTDTGRWISSRWPLQQPPLMQFALGRELNLVKLGSDRAGGRIALLPTPANPTRLTTDLYEDAPGPYDCAPPSGPGRFLTLAAPETEARDIVPGATLTCRLSSDRSGGQLVARLLDVAADGAAVRMAIGALNLALQSGTDRHAPPLPGEEMEVTVPFQAAAWRLVAGHRLGLELRAEGWPTLWPERSGASLAIDASSLRLILPVARGDETEPDFPPAVTADAARPGRLQRLDPRQHDLTSPRMPGAASLERRIAGHNLEVTGADYVGASRFELSLTDNGREAIAVKTSRFAVDRPGWSPEVETRLQVRSNGDVFEISWSVKAFEDGALVHEYADTAEVPRTAV